MNTKFITNLKPDNQKSLKSFLWKRFQVEMAVKFK